jgi:hypothetical protein
VKVKTGGVYERKTEKSTIFGFEVEESYKEKLYISHTLLHPALKIITDGIQYIHVTMTSYSAGRVAL